MRALVVVWFAAAAAAQVATTFPDVVLTQHAGLPTARLVALDRAFGTVTPLPGFASDGLPPRAVAIDPYDRALYVALDIGAAGCELVRLDRVGPAFTERFLAIVPGRVTGLAVTGGALYAATDDPQGGVFRVPRRGGAVVQTVFLPNVTAMHGYGPGQAIIGVAWTGRAGSAQTQSGFAMLDADTGAAFLGPMTFANPTGVEITGFADLWTGVPRHMLAFADGTFALVTNLQPPVTPFALPPVPAGGSVALLYAPLVSGAPVGLGGAPFPYLYAIDTWSQQVTVLSPPLPGAPVAFAPGETLGAQSIGVGDAACGPTVLTQGVGGLPQPGNNLSLWSQGPANSVSLLVASLDDFAGGALPFALPGGCELQISPDATLALVAAQNGIATHTLAIPGGSGLLGVILFSQWIALDGTFSTSPTLAHWIGL